MSSNSVKVNIDPHDVYLNSLPHRYDVNEHQQKLYPKKLDNDIYEVYDEHGHLSGKFMISNGSLTVLADYFGMVTKNFPAGPLDEVSTIMVKEPLGGLKAVSRSDIKNGLHLNNVQSHSPTMKYADKQFEDTRNERPASIFEYTNKGMKEPRIIEFKEGVAYLDGHELTEESLSRILVGVEDGSATLKYKSDLSLSEES